MTDVSICMVSLNCWHVLEPCLRSLEQSRGSFTYDVVLVDNASTDGTCDRVGMEFPGVRLIKNSQNVGFTLGTNTGIRASNGRLILWLNTDVLLRPNSIEELVHFLDTTPSAGIVGPKLLNADLSFQAQCRRGLPTVWASLAYMLKLHVIWPKAAWANGYLLSHIDPTMPAQVTAVSGACLLARREVFSQIGPLDEEIFGFGEDLDWCVRAKKAGWQVWYDPKSEVIHLKGQGGTHAKPYHKIWGIHQAMWVFYRKHIQSGNSRPLRLLVRGGITLSFCASMARTFIGRILQRIFKGLRLGTPYD